MASRPVGPAQRRLADALRALKRRQDRGQTVFRSAELERRDREALVRAGFLRPVVKGWYLAGRPGDAPGDTTAWFASFRDFVAGYCSARFGEDWHLAPAHSVQVHAGATVLPLQVVVHAPRGNNSVLELPAGCSLLDYRAKDFAPADQVEVRGGLRVLTLPASLVRVTEAFFHTSPTDAQVALTALRDTSALNRALLAGGHSVVAGRLTGAFRAIGRPEAADDLLATMRAAGYTVQESNPFLADPPRLGARNAASPTVSRLQLLWASMREEVLRSSPEEPGRPANIGAYLADVREVYAEDAYHSLSIEGYRVTDEMIQRVATGEWDPEQHAEDADARNALAAHGYWRAFEAVQLSLRRVLSGENPGSVVRADHGSWYRALFGPGVEAGILAPTDLAGYRSAPVYIRGSMHVPPAREAVPDLMQALFDLMAEEPSAVVRAVLGHFFFGFIHPYMDGNGRMARFLMNAMLASGGYRWSVIRVDRRDGYMAALEAASAGADIGPFAAFIAELLHERDGA